MSEDKVALEQGILKAMGDVETAAKVATDARSAANKAWDRGDTKSTEGRAALLLAEDTAKGAEAKVSTAKSLVTRLEASLVDLGKESARAEYNPLTAALTKAIKGVLAEERFKPLIAKAATLTGYSIPVDTCDPSGALLATGPNVSPKPIGPLFIRPKATRGGGNRGGNGKGDKYTFTLDGIDLDARAFVESDAFRQVYAPDVSSGKLKRHPADAVADGSAGVTDVAKRGAMRLGIMPVLITPKELIERA